MNLVRSYKIPHLPSPQHSHIYGSSPIRYNIVIRHIMEHPTNQNQEKIAHPQKDEQKPVQHVKEQKPEHQQVKPHEDIQPVKNETALKEAEPINSQANQEQQIRKLVFGLQPHITEERITQYIQFQKLQKRKITKENFEEWDRAYSKKEEVKAYDPPEIKQEEGPKVEKKQEPKALAPEETCEQYFQNYKQGQHTQIKPKIITLLNHFIAPSLPINANHVANYFKNQQQNHNLAHFKEWIIQTQQNQENQNIKYYQSTSGYTQLQKHFAKLKEVLNLVTSQKSNLKINLGVGENKGKTSIKCGLTLINKSQNNLEIVIEMKIKKKSQLKALIEGQVKKWQKLEGFNVFKLCKLDLSQTEKGLRITIHSLPFQTHICKDIIDSINSICHQKDDLIFNLQAELTIKNSIRSDQLTLQKKKFMKWLCEGLTAHLSVEGNTKIIQHFTSPFVQYFPIFKVIRSGEISLNTKNITSIDKLFQKLGINQISEETPTLQAFLAEIIKQYLGSDFFPWVSQILRKCIHFVSTIPNQRISIDVNGSLPHVHCSLSISSEACKQLAEVVLSTSSEMFS